jgi:hypothetical protein
MTAYTIELTSLVPNYRHVTVHAETLEQAVALALEDDGDQ